MVVPIDAFAYIPAFEDRYVQGRKFQSWIGSRTCSMKKTNGPRKNVLDESKHEKIILPVDDVMFELVNTACAVQCPSVDVVGPH